MDRACAAVIVELHCDIRISRQDRGAVRTILKHGRGLLQLRMLHALEIKITNHCELQHANYQHSCENADQPLASSTHTGINQPGSNANK
ncbi:hypothetical protein D3C87_1710770 [compost metagenome]